MKRLFGTDGIRGIAGKFPLTEEIIFNLGRAISEKLRVKRILIGDDSRESSSWILDTLSKGFGDSGVELDYTGTITTPALSKIVALDDVYDGGIMISASHNPAEFNGIKILNSNGMKLRDSLEVELEKRIFELLDKGNEIKANSNNIVRVNKSQLYLSFIEEKFDNSGNGKKIVIDCSNGGASSLAGEVFERMGYSVILMNCNPDGKNINKECGSLYPEKMAERVKKEQAFAGIAFDGDGDRVIFADERGEILNGDILIYIISDFYHKSGYGGGVVGTIMSNLSLEQKIKDMGLKFYRTPVGDKYVWEKMVESDSIIGGETSGHIILRDYQITGDGIIVALKVLEIVEKTGKTLSEFRREIPLAHQIMKNLPVTKKIPLEKLSSLKKLKSDAREIFGDKVRMIIRYSGTEPLLRIMIEGDKREKLEEFIENYSKKIMNEIEVIS